LIEGKLCFIKSLKAKKRKDIVSSLLSEGNEGNLPLAKKTKEKNFQRESDQKGFHAKHIPYVREHDPWSVKKRVSFLRLEEPTFSVPSEEQDKLINLFMKEGISKPSGEKVDYNWQEKTLLPVPSFFRRINTERRAVSSLKEEKTLKKKIPFLPPSRRYQALLSGKP